MCFIIVGGKVKFLWHRFQFQTYPHSEPTLNLRASLRSEFWFIIRFSELNLLANQQ